jgi:hypothetical protein
LTSIRASRQARRERRARSLVDRATEHRAQGRHAEAADDLGRAIRLCDEPSSDWHIALVEAVEAAGDARAVDDAYRGLILADSTSVKHVDAWTNSLRARSDTDAVGPLLDLQRSIDEPLPATLLRILSSERADEGRQVLAGQIARFVASDESQLCWSAWADYTSLRPLDEKVATGVRQLPTSVIQLVFLADPPKIVTLAEAVGAGLGVSAEAVNWYETEFLRADVPAGWADREFISDYARARVEVDERRLGYQNRIVRDRRFVLRDPYTNHEVVPFDNLNLFGRTLYAFGEERMTLLVAGNFGSSALFLSLADRNVLVDLGADMWQHMLLFRATNLHAQLLRRVAEKRELFAAACAAPPSVVAERRVVVMSMMVDNFAHHLWNCFPGIERLVDAGLAPHVDEVRVGGSEFFGPLVQLFPELAGATVVDEAGRGVRDPYPFSAEHLIVAPGGYFIRRELVNRVVSHMAALPPTPGAAQPPPDDDRPFPIVWFGFRTDSRSWVDQEHEAPFVIDAIHRAHPQALVVLDGFSRPVGHAAASGRWVGSIDRLTAVAETIRSSVMHPDRVVSLVGNTLRESVLWAAATDVYIAPNGTTQHKVGWFTDGPGISYSPPSIMEVPEERRPGAYESEGRPIPVTVIGAPQDVGEVQSAMTTRRHVENVRLDRDEITRALLELISQRADSLGHEH